METFSQLSIFTEASGGRPVFTVAKVNEYAKSLLTGDPILSDVLVGGEISNLRKHSSGHIYFTLKDSDASIRCAFFRQNAMRSAARLDDGMQATLRGYITIYPRDGSYQMVVQEAQAAGEGQLYAVFQKRKQELLEKGYFDESRKKLLPFFPKKIAIVTSPTGAVLRDIARVARSRWPGIELLLLPVAVQGEGAAEQIAWAIKKADSLPDIDVIITGRGGGSIEDLWAFNEQQVADAIFGCKKPVVSAVGHETDFTIADFCADVRASTPTHAAQLCVPDSFALKEQVRALQLRAQRHQRMSLDSLRERLARLTDRPVLQKPESFISLLREKTLALDSRSAGFLARFLADKRAGVNLLTEKAAALGPKSVLERGYAIIKKEERLVTGAENLLGDISITMHDGTKNARILDEQ
ncbi:MAG: exodeoxyribonuclease VII large subunit [Christensenellales bacterium]|jgi:exodeoxyribonuclease VII large subunit